MLRILAVDWGERRLGLALSDPLGLTAQPLPPVVLDPAPNPESALRAAADVVARVVMEHEVTRVVLGLPLLLSGEAGEAAQRVQVLAARLAARLALPVETWDERFTSALAEQSLREEGWRAGRRGPGGGRERARAKSAADKARVDQRAAVLLLQSWLDAHPSGGGATA